MTFERGGALTATLFEDEVPSVCKSILEIIPFESEVLHSRWCGREINFPINTRTTTPLENLTCQTSLLDLAYWRDPSEPPETATETLAIYYGPEYLRYYRGTLFVSVFGRIDGKDEKTLKHIGIRVWQNGKEKIKVEKI